MLLTEMKDLPCLDVFQGKLDAFAGKRAGTCGTDLRWVLTVQNEQGGMGRKAELMPAALSRCTLGQGQATPLLFGEGLKPSARAVAECDMSMRGGICRTAAKHLQICPGSCSSLQITHFPFLHPTGCTRTSCPPTPAVTNACAGRHWVCLGDPSCVFWARFSSFFWAWASCSELSRSFIERAAVNVRQGNAYDPLLSSPARCAGWFSPLAAVFKFATRCWERLQ